VGSLETIRPGLLEILRKNDVTKAGVFGSYARGEQKKGSDLDILVQFGARKSLLDLVGLEQDLEKALKRKVDLLTYDSLSPYLREYILSDEVRIL
jgi:predicted nucleotidyltransferase